VVVAAGLAVAFGLNSEPIFESGLAGDADAAGVAVGDAPAFVRAGGADAAGLAMVVGDASAFVRAPFFAGDGEASGLVAGAGEASVFFLRAFLAGETDASGLAPGDGAGLCASTTEAHAKIIIDKSRARFVVIKRKLEACPDFRQR